MTPSTTRRLVLAAVGLAVGAVVPGAGAAPTDQVPPVTGVWWELQPADGALPPPATELPAGGLWLQSTARGDSALSAVRLLVPEGQRAAQLVLTVHEDASAPGPGAVDVCPAAEAWKPPAASPGTWSGRAVPDCEQTRISGSRTDDGTAVVFDLAPLGGSPVVDLVLTSPDGSTSPIDITFAPPAADALRTAALPGPTAGAPPAEQEQPSAETFPAPPSIGSGDTSLPAFDSLSGSPSEPGFAPAPELGEEPAVTPLPAEQTPALAQEDVPAGADLAAARPEAGDPGRRAAAGALALIVLWALALLPSLREGSGTRGGGTYTLYRGAPPAR